MITKPFLIACQPINISGSKALNKKQNVVFKLKKQKPSEKWLHTPSSCGRSVPLSCVAIHCYHTLFTLSGIALSCSVQSWVTFVLSFVCPVFLCFVFCLDSECRNSWGQHWTTPLIKRTNLEKSAWKGSFFLSVFVFAHVFTFCPCLCLCQDKITLQTWLPSRN